MMQGLHNKRESYRVNIRKEKNRQIQAEWRAQIQREMLQKDDRHRILQAVIDQHFSSEQYLAANVTAVQLFPLLKSYIQQPTDDRILSDYLYLLVEEIFMSSAACTEEIVGYLLKFITDVPYNTLRKHKLFRMNFLGLLAQVTQTVRLPEINHLKRKLLVWCQGTNCLAVLTNCLQQFPSMNQYPHIFSLIEHGLESTSKPIREAAAKIVNRMGRLSDYDDMASIYFKAPNIFNNLINCIVEATQPQLKQLYGNAMVALCDTYDEAVCSYGKMGLGEIGCQLILSEKDSELSTGLKMIVELSRIVEEEQSMKTYLIKSPIAQKMWAKLGKLYNKENALYRRNFYCIMTNMLAAVNYDQLVDEFLPFLEVNILEVVDYGLSNEQNPYVLYCIAWIIRCLLYHSERMKEIHQINHVAAQLSQKGIFEKLETLFNRTEHTKTKEIVEEILEGHLLSQHNLPRDNQ